jgi:hypothetical protein
MRWTDEIGNILFSQMPGDTVILDWHSNSNLVPGDKIRRVLDCMEKRAIICAAGLDELNELEKLAVELLLDSAFLREYHD